MNLMNQKPQYPDYYLMFWDLSVALVTTAGCDESIKTKSNQFNYAAPDVQKNLMEL